MCVCIPIKFGPSNLIPDVAPMCHAQASAHLFRSASDKSQGPQLRNLHRDFDTLYNASEVLNGAETC